MSAPPWMPLYVADYLADTGHLTAAQHGAYLLLIMHYWRTGGLPKTDPELARIARMSEEEWQSHGNRITIASFFSSDWHHERIEFELSQALEIVSKRTAVGKLGAKVRWGKKKSLNSKRHAIANAEAIAKRCPSPSPSPSQEHTNVSEVDMSVGSRSKSANRGQRWPADAVVSDEWIELGSEARAKNQLPLIDLRLEAQRFANHWASATGTRATKKDWLKTWINWAISPFAGGKSNGSGQHGVIGPAGAVFRDNYLRARAEREGSGG